MAVGDLGLRGFSDEALLSAAQLYLPLPEQALALLDRVNPDELESAESYYQVRFRALRALGRFEEAERIYKLTRQR